MANIAGYRAVIEAGNNFGRFSTGQVTAADKLLPAKVLVIGADAAGLAATGVAVSLGAQTYAFDVRPEVAEQIESMGAEFVYLDFKGSVQDGAATGGDLAPKFYPVLGSLQRFLVTLFGAVAAGLGCGAVSAAQHRITSWVDGLSELSVNRRGNIGRRNTTGIVKPNPAPQGFHQLSRCRPSIISVPSDRETSRLSGRELHERPIHR